MALLQLFFMQAYIKVLRSYGVNFQNVFQQIFICINYDENNNVIQVYKSMFPIKNDTKSTNVLCTCSHRLSEVFRYVYCLCYSTEVKQMIIKCFTIIA